MTDNKSPWDGYWEFTCPVCVGSGKLKSPHCEQCPDCTKGKLRIPWTPEAGMLANDKRTGEWAVTEAIPNNPHIRYRVSTGLFSHVPNNAAAHCTPLLPSPATLQAHGLSVYDVAYQTFDQVDTSDDPHSTAGVICHRMEHMTLWWCGHDDKPHMLCKPITADNRNAAQRDLQRYTSLLAWLGGVE